MHLCFFHRFGNPALTFTVEHVQGVKLMDIQIHMRGYPYISRTRKRLRWFLKGHESQSVSGNDERLPPRAIYRHVQ